MTDFEKQLYGIIAKQGGITASELAKELHVDKARVYAALNDSAGLKTKVKQVGLKWYPAGMASVVAAASSPKPDRDLQKLCEYYLHCIGLESNCMVSQFLQSKIGKERYVVLNGLNIDPVSDPDAVSFLGEIIADKEKKAYLGYPVQIFTLYGKGGVPYRKLAPVFLFPVDYTGGVIDISWFPTINMEVLSRYCGGKGIGLANELVNLEADLGMNDPDSEAGVDDLVIQLQQKRDWEWREKLDPANIPVADSLYSLKDGIYNRPVLIEAEKLPYTDGLETELHALAILPEEEYKGTALYAWVKDQHADIHEGTGTNLLEVLPLNTEQALAVETAMSSDLTIVTGPPGTGKSQVVTDLLTNIAWNGKNVLFSSKNNKAVDVVEKRVNGLSSKPALLRIGNSKFINNLADIIQASLTKTATPDVQEELQVLQNKYSEYLEREARLKEQKDALVQIRNDLDISEQMFCEVRDVIGEHLFDITEADPDTLRSSVAVYSQAVKAAQKENNGFFARLFWSSVEPKRKEILESSAKEYDDLAARFDLMKTDPGHSDEAVKRVAASAEAFASAIPVALAYRANLEMAHDGVSLEETDRELLKIRSNRSSIAQQLWDRWLKAKQVRFTPAQRKEMSNFIAQVKLADGGGMAAQAAVMKQYGRMVELMNQYLQCWAVTSLSVRGRIPFRPGLFDYVIIDEASQCDIASIIPLLYRAKRAVIIGDPQQLDHISNLSNQQDNALVSKYDIEPVWSYSQCSLYDLATAKVTPGNIIQLRDHFRSCADIIEFSNRTFYDGSLRVATNHSKLIVPIGDKPGIRWINTVGQTIRPRSGSAFNNAEITAVVKELKRLVEAGYQGSIGVTTPFRLQAEKIMEALQKEPELLSSLIGKHEFLAETVHKFQGDERDLMIFSCVVSNGTAHESESYLKNTGNLFNVAISRARAMLVVVGDYRYCESCSVSYLSQFALYCRELAMGKKTSPSHAATPLDGSYPPVPNPAQVSDYERILYKALFDAGISTQPQYPVDRYSLDLALIMPNNRMLDIEVDGKMYHQSWNKELAYRDQLRNQRLFELGWDVKRFWVSQIRDDLDWCVQQVQTWKEKNLQQK